MTTITNSFVYKNALPSKIGEKLYLDVDSADVFFVLPSKSGGIERVPAHRNILGVISPVFKSMFYGPIEHEGDWHVPNVTLAAFKEFLQFFYLENVTIAAENMTDVSKLRKHYLNDDSMGLLEDNFKTSLVLDDNRTRGIEPNQQSRSTSKCIEVTIEQAPNQIYKKKFYIRI